MSNLNYTIMHGDLDLVSEIPGIKEYKCSFDVHSLCVKSKSKSSKSDTVP